MIAPDADLAATWRKSSYSSDQANCIEVGAWRKSSYSSNQANCVEVAAAPDLASASVMVGIRDTKDRAAGHLSVPAAGWVAFLQATRH
ncbi:DUF397 domain-containing protein [Amycolatopsis sp. FDAARGOS 1241]|uniref:DUF397 domain-containing protein n=1 Tax=Amycolatopsis sp. FDAARGOS 1241 TaxID=2778070 RepID=UPI00195254F4|nr:DUF397 domain-containing protein [Amycolatopsis sp. FDAARGOS 1241]QRP45226.1 DUF397 domain-containing protein [Amycolatopsis sp. FDAARGOS 1241]